MLMTKNQWWKITLYALRATMHISIFVLLAAVLNNLLHFMPETHSNRQVLCSSSLGKIVYCYLSFEITTEGAL
jgi:hypothetical protein